MPRLGFEPMISVIKSQKIIRVLYIAPTVQVIGCYKYLTVRNIDPFFKMGRACSMNRKEKECI
jgi:hypothetical protein